jgi:hypothetical protein
MTSVTNSQPPRTKTLALVYAQQHFGILPAVVPLEAPVGDAADETTRIPPRRRRTAMRASAEQAPMTISEMKRERLRSLTANHLAISPAMWRWMTEFRAVCGDVLGGPAWQRQARAASVAPGSPVARGGGEPRRPRSADWPCRSLRDVAAACAYPANLLSSAASDRAAALADLASLDHVRKLADRITSDHDAITLLINNAEIGGGRSPCRRGHSCPSSGVSGGQPYRSWQPFSAAILQP